MNRWKPSSGSSSELVQLWTAIHKRSEEVDVLVTSHNAGIVHLCEKWNHAPYWVSWRAKATKVCRTGQSLQEIARKFCPWALMQLLLWLFTICASILPGSNRLLLSLRWVCITIYIYHNCKMRVTFAAVTFFNEMMLAEHWRQRIENAKMHWQSHENAKMH